MKDTKRSKATEANQTQDSEAQISESQEYCQQKGIDVDAELDVSLTSSKEIREIVNQAVEMTKNSPKKLVLVFDGLDVLQGKASIIPLLEDLRKTGKAELHFVRENLIMHSRSCIADCRRWLNAQSYLRDITLKIKRT